MTIAGRYDLKAVLGVGGMGAVYRAKHRVTEHEVALKLLFPDVLQHPEIAQRFLREATAAARIGHPGVVRVLDADMDGRAGEIFLVMELLEGEDLSAVFDRGGVSMERFLDLIIELLDGLIAAHSRGFVHRDIKPENIFLAREPDGSTRVKLLDFGIARFNEPSGGVQTTVGTILGTPHYMAPEQAVGKPVDARADLWSLGAMLFHAFVGHPPFDGDNANVVIAAIIYQPSPLLAAFRPDLPEALAQFVDRALQKDPDARWSDAETMQRALRQVRRGLAGPPITLSSTLRKQRTRLEWSVPPKTTTRLSPRNVKLAAGVLAVLCVSLLVGVSAGLRADRPRPVYRWQPAPPAAPPATIIAVPAAIAADPATVATAAVSREPPALLPPQVAPTPHAPVVAAARHRPTVRPVATDRPAAHVSRPPRPQSPVVRPVGVVSPLAPARPRADPPAPTPAPQRDPHSASDSLKP